MIVHTYSMSILWTSILEASFGASQLFKIQTRRDYHICWCIQYGKTRRRIS